MKKIWRVFLYEYLRHVLRKRFIFAVLSLPMIVVAMGIFGVIMVALQYDGRPVGYVDLANWLANPVESAPDAAELFRDVEIVAFPGEEAALQALEKGEIQGYYVFSKNYLESGEVRLVAKETPSQGAQTAFESFVRENLVKDLPKEVQIRLLSGDRLNIQTLDGSRQSGEGRWVEIAIPLATGVLFMFVVNMTGGYLLRAVVEEKENRTMEIVITSVSPTQLMAGKIVGNLSVGLTQLFLWLVAPIAGLIFLRSFVPWIQSIQVFTPTFWLTMAAILPAFIMVAALMAAVGATATETSEASAVAGWFTIPLVMPYWFMSLLMKNPNAPLSVVMSLFPLTAPVTLPVRFAFTTVPVWQTAFSIALLYVCAAASIWLAGRAFRLGMLRYGKRLALKELFGLEKKAL
ncbi:MAG: ABC transporter permease [Anaerolineae bacterium]|nr:ABC transporter permease [Anaerolineae bacterium]